MTAPLVSIIIPVLNAASFLKETCLSLINQTYDPVELIFVDDGSSDQSEIIIRGFLKDHENVKLCQQSRRGAAAARNTGLKMATGEYLKFWDADDLMNREHIQLQVKALEGTTEHVASCEWARFKEDPETAVFQPESVWEDLGSAEWVTRALTQRDDMASSWLWLIPRKVMERSGKWNERLSLNDDFEFSMRMLKNCSGVKFARGAKAYYRTLGSGLASGTSHEAYEAALLATELGCGHVLEMNSNGHTRTLCANRYQEWAYRIYPRFPDLTRSIEQRIKGLGGSTIKIPGGPVLKVLASVFGWKLARRIQLFFYGLGYTKLIQKVRVF